MRSAENAPVREEFDPSTTASSTALIEALATAEGTEPTRDADDVDIHDHLDADGLDRLIAGSSTDVITVSLSIRGHSVDVRSDGVVVVEPREE